MTLPLASAWRALRHPMGAFADEPPPLGRALLRMLALWTPPALLQAAGTTWQALQAYEHLRAGQMPGWLVGVLGLPPEELKAFLASLAPAPAFSVVWPWLLLLVPLGLLGTWFHHAVWDHTGLWLLGGLKAKCGFRASLVAEAEALRIAALGSFAGLLGLLPWLGWLLALPLMLLDGYLWLFRGFALAARHRCEPWRGVAATVVHVLLFMLFVAFIVGAMWMLLPGTP
jgi:hypothetical protein